jgi:hypothetical protein
MGELAVVGEHEQSRGLGIQPADVVEPLVPVLRETAQVGAALLVLHRRDDAGRLVEHDVALGGVELDRRAVHVDEVGCRVDAAPELGDDLSVHPDAALDDVLLADAARGDAGVREHLLQAHALGIRCVRHRSTSASKPSEPSSSSGEMCGSSSRELMPRFTSSASVVP